MLFKKMIRDIKENKTQFISIFLMAFLGVFVFTGISAECIGLQHSGNLFYNQTNFADGWIYGNDLNDNILNKVDNLNSTSSSERQLIIKSTAKLKGNPEITLHFLEKNKISKFYLLEGKPLDINDKNGIWLDKRFADTKNLSLGDNITLDYNGIEIEKEIKGLGYSPEYVYEYSGNTLTPDFSKYGFAYLSYKGFPSSIQYNTILVKTHDDIHNYEKQINNTLKDNYTSFVSHDTHISYSQYASEIDQHKMMGDIFPIVFIIIAFLTLLTTMTRLVANQRTEIGTLKSLGFSNKSIILHYISYGFYLVLAGGILGLILGPISLPYLFYPSMSSFYTLPNWDPGFDIKFIVMAILMVLFATLVTYLATRSISKESPAVAIRPKPPKITTTGFLEKLKIWNKLSFNVRWNYRDTKRNKVRGLMTIIGVMGCTALLISAFGMNDCINEVRDWQYNDISHYESKLVLSNNVNITDIDKIVNEIDGDKIMESSVEIKANNVKKSGSLLVYNETSLITPTNDNREQINLPRDGVSISKKMAELLGVEKGDSIQWHVSGVNKWVKTNISEIYSDPTSQGLIVHEKHFKDLGYNYTPTSILTSEHINKNYTGVDTVNTIDDLVNSWNDLTESMIIMVFTLITFASILSIVVLYNLGLLSFTEIERDMATLKVIGFRTKNLRKLLLTQNLWFSTIGFILGIPLGYMLIKAMLDSSGDSFYYSLHLSLFNLALTFLITFGLSILVNLLFSRKIKNINMVESLKGVE